MTMARVITPLLLLVSVCVGLGSDLRYRSSDSFLQTLFDLTAKQQIKQDESFKPFVHWKRDKGVYASGVRLNFHGKLEMAEPRRLVEVFDNNMFVMAWISSALLEANKYGGAPRPTDDQLTLSLDAMRNYHSKNQAYNTSVMTFWSQTYNKTTQFWECTPDNLFGAFEMANDLPLHQIEKLLQILGLDDLANDIEETIGEENSFIRAFHIPPDFDDTFVNLGLGSLLYQLRDEFPKVWNLWNSQNTNLTSVFDALKKYAYRPFSEDPDTNSIDPRTYLHIRGFLDQAKKEGKDVALVPTWVQSITELRTQIYLGVGMPFEINNVDVTVAANTIFGITSGVLSGLVNSKVLEDPLVAQVYLNTSSLIAYEIMNNFTGRPDLALTYYPSRIEFYWFVARTVFIIETFLKHNVLPQEVINAVYHILLDVAEGPMTKDILSMAKHEDTQKVYYDDFLGDGDLTLDGKPLVRGEDRIFTTAMAANALMYTWTYYDEKAGKSYWKQGTQAVREIVTGCINWLKEHTLDGKFEPWNAFFSGSGKSFESLPFWYPGNRFEYVNGTPIHDWSSIPNNTFIYGMQGYVVPEQYDAMLKEKHFGMNTPMTFGGFNNGSEFFPFWSSVPYTYATTLLAVSRFDNVIDEM